MIETLVALVFVLLALLFVVIGVVLYKLLVKVEKKEKATTFKVAIKKASTYDAALKILLYNLKKELSADKVIVARFHNGGNFANGYEMKKFTVTHETPGGTSIPLMDKQVAVLNSRYSEAILHLVSIGNYSIADCTDCTDQSFRHDMQEYGFQATYLFLIRQIDGTEEGFVGVNFKSTHVMTPEHRQKVSEKLTDILGVLNMTPIEHE
jgi:hypothetical protein